ncbi:MAG: hypothetical protein JO098_04515 [Candidatus Eremiobacteraeota bacterium]|nr:hypothetical protein [Candidatus Eremiobacteraeota bacterium]
MDPSIQAATTPTASATSVSPTTPDERQIARFLARLRDNQNFGAAIAGGLVGAIIGAVLWAVLTVLTNFEIGWEAVGVGFLVGFGVRKLGRGIDPVFGYLGAILSLGGIALGNILTGMAVIATHNHMSLVDVAMRLNPSNTWMLLTAGFTPIDSLFYGLGIYYGYKYSFHRPTAEELSTLR